MFGVGEALDTFGVRCLVRDCYRFWCRQLAFIAILENYSFIYFAYSLRMTYANKLYTIEGLFVRIRFFKGDRI